ncbi:hypothetical protein SKAU_G00026630 [Synaphobranchus kaupii]|uniref:Uncharacterized protein n=1 Tax=Synaphobranchus kaupii TaxID=118154 RepID=A0A9Q1JEH7_SYNKA|nr:hypothetical protein SKAU_G00026630 [Synaphobranchus kaupii]
MFAHTEDFQCFSLREGELQQEARRFSVLRSGGSGTRAGSSRFEGLFCFPPSDRPQHQQCGDTMAIPLMPDSAVCLLMQQLSTFTCVAVLFGSDSRGLSGLHAEICKVCTPFPESALHHCSTCAPHLSGDARRHGDKTFPLLGWE